MGYYSSFPVICLLPDINQIYSQDSVTHSQFASCGGSSTGDDFTDVNSLK
jgi:hypothetical protein